MTVRLLICAGMLALASACANAPTPPPPAAPVAPAPAAQIKPWGFDLAGRDTTIKPGDDFFNYSGGAWMGANQIPADRVRWGAFDVLRAKSEQDVRDIVEPLAAAHAAGGNEQKIGDFYSAFMDTAAIEKLGLGPTQPGLDAIGKAKTHEQIAALIASPSFPVDGPIGIGISLDEKNPDRYIIAVVHSGLSLPDKEYYLNKDAQFSELRAKFQAHVERMLALAGHRRAKAEAKQILALETEIAKQHWDIAKRRERDLTYNPVTPDELKKKAGAYPWDATFRSAGLEGRKDIVVAEWSAIPPLSTLFRKTPVATWRTYLVYHYLVGEASVLPKAFDDENFDFYGHTLNGQPQQRDRWKRAVAAVDGALGEAVGPFYVAKHFTPEAKAKMDALVENLRKGYAQHLQNVPWMSPETKKVALEKLAAFRPKIGYPTRWRDYSGLQIKPGDAFGNKQRSAEFDWRRDVDRLGKPSDRDEWGMTPSTVNAYYNPVFNEVVFPAAILQPPFFDANADPAVNYGGIGGVIGHEMGHGFDDQGAKSDAKGVLHTWWRQDDIDAFHKRTEALAAQYDQFEALKGLRVNGHLTLGENIGDLGGLTIARDAYLISLGGGPGPVIDGFTADQRFYNGWAQVWRQMIRDPALRNQVLSDPHSPAQFRVNGVVRNIDAWYAAFDVKPGDKLYLPPAQRVKIW